MTEEAPTPMSTWQVIEAFMGIELDSRPMPWEDGTMSFPEPDRTKNCAACGNAAVYAVTPPEPFRDPSGAWYCCESHLPSPDGIAYYVYRDAVRPL